MQAAGGAFGTIGLSQRSLSQSANRYGQALAQRTPRKVALLVGVNAYSRGRLQGALNDVELQKQLLIHRFGFNAADVHMLKEEQASRQNILGAFDEYLYKPAQAGIDFYQQSLVTKRDAGDRAGEAATLPENLEGLRHPHYWAPFILIGNGL